MYSFKILRLIFGFFVIFISCQLFGQPDSTKIPHKKYALQFLISSNFSLRSFQGSLISFKRNFSDKTALRVGIDLLGYSGNIEQKTYLSPNDSTLRDRKIDQHEIDFGFTSQFIFYPTKDNIEVFFGGGPIINYAHTKNNDDYRTPYGLSDRTEEVWSFGLSFPIGVEWHFRNNMSLSAEYGLLIFYRLQNEEVVIDSNNPDFNHQIDKEDRNAFFVSPSSVLFGLSVYF